MEQVDEIEQGAADDWNGAGGRNWAALHEVMDRVLQPFEDVLVAAVRDAGATRVLDVGCGAGATTLAIAGELGGRGSCTGIDISAPLLAAARERAAQAGPSASFVLADAQRHAFEPAFDLVVSRFGVMFFDDPVAAFANLRTAVRVGGGLRLLTWRRPEDNPFMIAAEEAAASVFPVPPRDPDAPGQFALADADRVRALLAASGWQEGEVEPVDLECSVDAAAFDLYLTHLGPLGRALADADEATTARVLDAVRPAFDPFRAGDELRFVAACWLLRARA